MDKKLINEDIANMKYLLGYKAGRVISEQEQPEIDEYFHGDMKDLNRSKYPERLVRHSDTGKLVGTHKHGEGFHPNPHGEELGFEHHPMDIPHGTKFGGTEIGDFDYEDDEFNLDEEDHFDENEEETTESILEKHHLLDETKTVKENMVMFQGKSPEVIQRFLSILHLLTDVVFLSIVDCEFADFSNVDICGLQNLVFITLMGTENNFDEQDYGCADKEPDNFYVIEDNKI